MTKVNVTRMEQLIGKDLEMIVAGEEGSLIGTLRKVIGRKAIFSGFDVWIPDIKSIVEVPPE